MLSSRAGDETVSSRKKAKRDETVSISSRLLTLSRETVSKNILYLGLYDAKNDVLNFAKKYPRTVSRSRISSRLVTFGLETDGTRPSRVSSRLVTFVS